MIRPFGMHHKQFNDSETARKLLAYTLLDQALEAEDAEKGREEDWKAQRCLGHNESR